ncbi:hypothetical protein FDECE_836 [Fusarium decemcellulare]|nr:hypothetical protein FDECE_836 [Fusarium decemcellulare]
MLSIGTAVLFLVALGIVVAARRVLVKERVAQAPAEIIPRVSKPKTITQPLPESWYKSDDIYELERRAIFSKKWVLITHKQRFPESGSWIRYEEAGFNFFLIRNKEGMIRAFHNICRHRAFPVVTKDQGQNMVLSCKYHGWSYGLNGQLAKAPMYGDMQGFDKSKNGLFPIHTHVDEKGFVWINMDAKDVPEVAWNDDFAGIDRLARHQPFNLNDYTFDHSRQETSANNWKTVADKYASSSKIEQDEKAITIVSDFYFPNAALTISPHFFFMMRCNPVSSTESTMEFEVFRHKDASDEQFQKIDDIFNQTLEEDKSLPNPAEKTFNSSVLGDDSPLFFQNQVHQLLEQHRQLEDVRGKEVRPAQQVVPTEAGATEQDESLFSSCAGLACGKLAKQLAW